MADEKNIKFSDLIWIGTGQVVGAGVVTIVGSALAVTGYSAWFAYSVAVLFGLMRILPQAFFFSAVVAPGGTYGMITRCCGKQYGGLVTLSNLLAWVARGTAVLSLANYVAAMFPSVNKIVAGVIIWGFLAVANLFGVDVMAKLQAFATPCLLACLMAFSVLCAFNIQEGYLDFSSPLMFTNGVSGFLSAVVLLCYSTHGHQSVCNFATRCVNPKRDIPKALFCISGIIFVLYTSVGFASGAVLPLEVTANGTLTDTARTLLPTSLYYVFMVGGPIFALLTTMNSGIMNSAMPVLAGVKEGWLPKFLVKQNRYGAYWVAIVIIFVIGCLPLCTGMSVSQITNMTLVLSAISSTLLLISGFTFPKKFPKEWAESPYHVNSGVYMILMLLSGAAQAFVIIQSLMDLTTSLAILNVALLAIAFFYGLWRIKRVEITETDFV